MGLPRLEKCCFCFDLRIGIILLACINIMCSFIFAICMIVASANADHFIPSGLVSDKDQKLVVSTFYVIAIILVLSFIAKLFFDVLLLYGVLHKRANIIKAYLFIWLLFFVLFVFAFFVGISEFDVSSIITLFFYIGFNVYFILLCYSLYRQLIEKPVR